MADGGAHAAVRTRTVSMSTSASWTYAAPESNQFVLGQQVTYRQGGVEVRFDLVLFVNGIPLVVIEAKTPVRKAVTWVDGAMQVHDDYERNAPRFFVPNAFSSATDGKDLRYGAIRMPLLLWGPWRSDDPVLVNLSEVQQAAAELLNPVTVLDVLRLVHVSSRPTRSTAKSRSSAATSSTRRPTASSSG